MKKTKVKDNFLAELRRIPIVQVACEKVGVSRNSVYRWRNEDETFRKEMETALADGEALINDMTESQLLVLIKEKNWSAMSFWLRHRNPKFRERIEVTTNLEKEDVLTPEQKELVEKAMEFATRVTSDGVKPKEHGN